MILKFSITKEILFLLKIFPTQLRNVFRHFFCEQQIYFFPENPQ